MKSATARDSSLNQTNNPRLKSAIHHMAEGATTAGSIGAIFCAIGAIGVGAVGGYTLAAAGIAAAIGAQALATAALKLTESTQKYARLLVSAEGKLQHRQWRKAGTALTAAFALAAGIAGGAAANQLLHPQAAESNRATASTPAKNLVAAELIGIDCHLPSTNTAADNNQSPANHNMISHYEITSGCRLLLR